MQLNRRAIVSRDSFLTTYKESLAPLEKIAPPDGLELAALLPFQDVDSYTHLLQPNATAADFGWFSVYACGEFTWELALGWFYKKAFNPKHKMPRDKQSSAIEPLGGLLWSLYELSKECHAHDFGTEYRRASHWFSAVATEIEHISFFAPHKKQPVSRLRAVSKAFDGEHVAIGNYPHLQRLLMAAKALKNNPQDRERGEEFSRRYLTRSQETKDLPKGVREALGAWATALDRNQLFAVQRGSERGLSTLGRGGSEKHIGKRALLRGAKAGFSESTKTADR
jgi:hypothetical protein